MTDTRADRAGSFELTLALLAAWTAAVAKPLLDVFGAAPEYWTANRIDIATIVAVPFVLTLLPPLVLAGALILLGRVPSSGAARGILFNFLLAALSSIACYHIASVFAGKSLVVAAAGLVAGVLVAMLYGRSANVRRFVSYCSALALLVPLTFLLLGPTFSLLKPAARASSARATLDAPVVIVVFDEMSLPSLLDENAEIDGRRFPNLRRVASMSTWYRNATVNHGSTERSVPSLLTGKLQGGKSAATSYRQSPDNLFTMIDAPDGVLSIEPATQLCPPEICGITSRSWGQQISVIAADLLLVYQNIIVPDRFASRVRPIPHRFRDLASGDAGLDQSASATIDSTEAAKSAAAWLEAGRTRSLLFLHFDTPHAPYLRNPDGSFYTRSGSYAMPGWEKQPHRWKAGARFAVSQALQRYMLQAMYADSLLGIVLDGLERSGRLEASTVVVTADHGVGFTPGGRRRALTLKGAAGVVAELNCVPLFWKSRGQLTPRISDVNAETIDIVPTLLDELGASLPEASDRGTSLVGSSHRPSKNFGGASWDKDAWPLVLDASARLRSQLAPPAGPEVARFVSLAWHANAIGQPITTARSSKTQVELDNAQALAALAHYDPDSHVRPNMLSGRIGPGISSRDLAIAINGRIVDVVEWYEDESGTRRFDSVFDPSTLRKGKNELQFCELRVRPDGTLDLTMLGQRATSFRFDGKQIVDADGSALQRDQSRVIGGFDQVEKFGAGWVHVSGWLADRRNMTPAVAMLFVFRGEQHLVRPDMIRPDLTEFGEKLTTSGFDTSLPLDGRPFEAGELKAFAIFDGSTYAEITPAVGFVQGEAGGKPAAQGGAQASPRSAEASRALFERMVRKEIGLESGKIELRTRGILIHPGTTPTSATFALKGELKQLRLRLFIAELDAGGKAVSAAGNVNVELILDGKPILSAAVDRNTQVEKTLDVSGNDELTVRVDNANGKPWWDWLILSVVEP